MEYVEHSVAFVPTESTAVIYPSEPATTPPASPVDLTMLAMLGLTVAGAGVMKTQTAIAKQNELNAQKAQQLADLQAQQSAQKADANANWEENLAMQAEAGQDVVVGVEQSQANKNYWAAFAIWQARVAEARARRWANNQKPLITVAKPSRSSSRSISPFAIVLGVMIIGAGLLGTLQSRNTKEQQVFEKPPKDAQAVTNVCRQLTASTPIPFDDFICGVIGVVEQTDDLGRLLGQIDDMLVTIGIGTVSANTIIIDEANPLLFNVAGVMDNQNTVTDTPEEDANAIAIDQLRTRVLEQVQELTNRVQTEQKHIALGQNFTEGNPMALGIFTLNLNLLLNSASPNLRIKVYSYSIFPPLSQTWYDAGLSTVPPNRATFNESFRQATRNAQIIHFNLDGIPLDNPREWANLYGSTAQFPPSESQNQYWTAIELYIISRDPILCAKTIFYNNGGGIFLLPPPEVNLEIKARICS